MPKPWPSLAFLTRQIGQSLGRAPGTLDAPTWGGSLGGLPLWLTELVLATIAVASIAHRARAWGRASRRLTAASSTPTTRTPRPEMFSTYLPPTLPRSLHPPPPPLQPAARGGPPCSPWLRTWARCPAACHSRRPGAPHAAQRRRRSRWRCCRRSGFWCGPGSATARPPPARSSSASAAAARGPRAGVRGGRLPAGSAPARNPPWVLRRPPGREAGQEGGASASAAAAAPLPPHWGCGWLCCGGDGLEAAARSWRPGLGGTPAPPPRASRLSRAPLQREGQNQSPQRPADCRAPPAHRNGEALCCLETELRAAYL